MLLVFIAGSTLTPALQPLQFLVGHCWRTTLKEGPTDTHCFVALAGGTQVRDRHTVRKEGRPIYTGESVFTAPAGKLHFIYTGSTGAHIEGPMHVAGDKIIFDDVDKTGSETSWRQVDATHYEDVTVAPPALSHFNQRKLFELVRDEKP